MVIPGNLAVIVFGVVLAWIIKAPILGFLNVPLIFLPRGRLFRVALEDALAKGQMTPELRLHLADPVVRLAHGYEMVSMIVIVYLMVFKPF